MEKIEALKQLYLNKPENKPGLSLMISFEPGVWEQYYAYVKR